MRGLCRRAMIKGKNTEEGKGDEGGSVKQRVDGAAFLDGLTMNDVADDSETLLRCYLSMLDNDGWDVAALI